MISKFFTVTQINRYLKSIIEEDILLSNISVSGEISNVRHYKSGNQIYFTLKDNSSQISCVMFSNVLQRIKVPPADGLQVLLKGRVYLYEKRGQYNLQVFYLEPFGIGELASAFEKLKEKLLKEGLFSPEKKKQLPLYPEKIAVLAAENGAAIKDILAVVKRRSPFTQIKLFPTIVQGGNAPDSILEQLKLAQIDESIEIIIMARGGGSL